jgi:hypothetical protein
MERDKAFLTFSLVTGYTFYDYYSTQSTRRKGMIPKRNKKTRLDACWGESPERGTMDSM